jgi:hypothetical protein
MKKSEVAKALTIVTTAYPTFEATVPSVNMWHSLFPDTDMDTFMGALKAHILASKFPPTPADVAALINTPDYPEMSEAWAEVRNRIQYVGYYGIPEFTHPLIEHVVEAMGWQNLCDMTNPDTTRAHFFRLFQSATDRMLKTGKLPASPKKALPQEGAANAIAELANGMKEIE